MYSLALMTYDAPYGLVPPSSSTPAEIASHSKSMKSLWTIHRLVLNTFKDIDPLAYNKENYDQYGMFFELMRVIPGGDELVMDVVGKIPRTTGVWRIRTLRRHGFLCRATFHHIVSYTIMSYVIMSRPTLLYLTPL